jgi:hypothetical protein
MDNLNSLSNDDIPHSTSQYLRENEFAFSLPREKDEAFAKFVGARAIRKQTVFAMLVDKFRQATFGSLRYFYAVVREFESLKKLSALRSSKIGKRALVLGNGPSLGYLSSSQIKRFQEFGGELFAVNFWTSTLHAGVIPDYLVISDGVSLIDRSSKFGEMQSEDVKKKNELLCAFLHTNKLIKIICPLARVKELANQFGSHRIIGFVDHEMRGITANIDPRYPRGYVSMTLFKALAISIHMGYEEICVLGMDNTFPRDVFCDCNNTIFRIERHAGEDNVLFDQTAYYPSMDVWAQDLFDLFLDLHRCFKGYPVLNLDPYSLTDVFRKIDGFGSIELALRIVESSIDNHQLKQD